MIQASYVDQNEDGRKLYRVFTTKGKVWEASHHGNVTRHRPSVQSEELGRKTHFESFPIGVQKKILKAMGVHPLMVMWYVYSPIKDLTKIKEEPS